MYAHTRNSFDRRLAAAALGLALVLAGAGTAESATITCQFGTFSACTGDTTGESFVFGNDARFAFDPDLVGGPDYYVDLFFDIVLGPFNVSITDVFVTQAEMDAKFADNFPGYICVPIYGGPLGASCVEFDIDADDPGPNTWVSEGGRGNTPGNIGYNMLISWFAATDPPFNDPKILKDTGPEDGIYDFDMTIPGSYFNGDPPPPPGCFECDIELAAKAPGTDPGIGGRDIQFSTNIVAQQNVPEPATLALMGLGLTAVAYVARRRRRSA